MRMSGETGTSIDSPAATEALTPPEAPASLADPNAAPLLQHAEGTGVLTIARNKRMLARLLSGRKSTKTENQCEQQRIRTLKR